MAKVREGGGAYYLAVAAGVGTGIEAPGRWGPGASVLGLTGEVAGPDLDAVLAGRRPGDGAVLGSGRDRVTVAGFDLTFSAPKSVSLLHALGDGEVADAVAAGHDEAVAAALGYVDVHALAVRRRTGDGRAVPRPVAGVAAASFVHRVSRAHDPHLHTHVVVANLGRGPEGRWSALDGRGVYAHAAATDALYHAHLRDELTRRLGVRFETCDRGRADIAGIGPEARGAFSRRAAAIAAHLTERGLVSGRARTVAGFATRAERDGDIGADELRAEWRRRALAVGLGPNRLEAVLDRVPRRSGADRAGPRPVEAAEAYFEPGRTVTRRDAVRAVGRSLPAGAPGPAVEEAADRLLDQLGPEPGPRGERDGPGVAERRHAVPERELAVSLARRAMVPARTGPELDRRAGVGLGY